MIDRAIDKLKYELQQKEKDVIQPLTYRQKVMQEDADAQRKRLEDRIISLENMVLMQEKTINFLTGRTDMMDKNIQLS